MRSIKKEIYYSLINYFGYKISRPIVVFESDDWGGIRIPNIKTYTKLLYSGIKVDNCPYSKNDSLEREEDVDFLMNLLSSHSTNENKVRFTLNFNVANPDFNKIKSNDFKKYYYEMFTDTYNRYGSKALLSIKEGIKEGFFTPQYHGREHLNIPMWLSLIEKNEHVKIAFDNEVYALSFKASDSIDLPYLAAYYPFENYGLKDMLTVIEDGIKIFKNVFGVNPITFIPPVYIYEKELEKYISKLGIKGIQGLPIKKEPITGKKNFRFYNTYNNFDQVQLIRNVHFEPSTSSGIDWVNNALREIQIAFRYNKPVIISSHRLNYMGGLNIKNRDTNLKLLDELLKMIIKKWPNVKFMDSALLTKEVLNLENVSKF
ncbi:MAG: hypothetical protein KDC67_05070 [Ignavibacteriae bacterium]|nr:hypothetical protein [Ignavibacteriota bacterium]